MTLYQQISESIAALIRSGALRPGDALPSVRAASRAHKVSKGTIVQAYGALEMQELIETRPRSGYFVTGQSTRRRLDANAVNEGRPKLKLVDLHVLVSRVRLGARLFVVGLDPGDMDHLRQLKPSEVLGIWEHGYNPTTGMWEPA